MRRTRGKERARFARLRSAPRLPKANGVHESSLSIKKNHCMLFMYTSWKCQPPHRALQLRPTLPGCPKCHGAGCKSVLISECFIRVYFVSRARALARVNTGCVYSTLLHMPAPADGAAARGIHTALSVGERGREGGREGGGTRYVCIIDSRQPRD